MSTNVSALFKFVFKVPFIFLNQMNSRMIYYQKICCCKNIKLFIYYPLSLKRRILSSLPFYFNGIFILLPPHFSNFKTIVKIFIFIDCVYFFFDIYLMFQTRFCKIIEQYKIYPVA